MNQTPTILTITGSDGTCCSGIQADIRLIGEMGATPVSVVTSVTAQNTLGIQEFYDLPATAVRLQMEAIDCYAAPTLSRSLPTSSAAIGPSMWSMPR